MNVTVYFAQDELTVQRVLMIVPVDTEPTVVEELKEYGWRLLTTTTLDDQLLRPRGRWLITNLWMGAVLVAANAALSLRS